MELAFGQNGTESLAAIDRAEAENGWKMPLSAYEAALAVANVERGWLAYRAAHRALEDRDAERAASHAKTALTEPLNPLATSTCHELVADAAARRGDVATAERHYVLSLFEDNLRLTAWNSLRALLVSTGSAEANEMFFSFLGVPESVITRACPGAEGACVPRKPPPWPIHRFPNARTYSPSPPRGVLPFNYSIEERLRTPVTVDDLLVWEFTGAELLYRDGSMHVIHDGALVTPLCTGDLRKEMLAEASAERIPGTVGVLADLFYAPNYAHWLLDAMPRIFVLKSALNRPIDYFLANWSGAPYQMEHLRAVGIRPEQLLSVTDHPCIAADRLLISSASMSIHHPAQGGAKWATDFLRRTLLPEGTSTTPARRLFVSRKDGRTRRIVNEDELFNALKTRFGFERVVLSEHSALEQARLFRDAEVVVAAHGAGNANFVFCGPGTRIFELFSPLHGTAAFFQIAEAVGAEYHAVDGDDALRVPPSELVRGTENPYGGRDVVIDAGRLTRVLEEAGVSR